MGGADDPARHCSRSPRASQPSSCFVRITLQVCSGRGFPAGVWPTTERYSSPRPTVSAASTQADARSCLHTQPVSPCASSTAAEVSCPARFQPERESTMWSGRSITICSPCAVWNCSHISSWVRLDTAYSDQSGRCASAQAHRSVSISCGALNCGATDKRQCRECTHSRRPIEELHLRVCSPAGRHVHQPLYGRCVCDCVQDVEEAVHLHQKGQPVHFVFAANRLGRRWVEHCRVDHSVAAKHGAADRRGLEEVALEPLVPSTRRSRHLPGRRGLGRGALFLGLPRGGEVVAHLLRAAGSGIRLTARWLASKHIRLGGWAGTHHLVSSVQQRADDCGARPARGAGDEHPHPAQHSTHSGRNCPSSSWSP